MSSPNAATIATWAALLALWAESASLAWWFDPSTSAVGYAAACVGGTLAAGVVLIPISRFELSTWSAVEWIVLFLVSLLLSLAFLALDCQGTLSLVDGHPTCGRIGGGLLIALTLAAMAVATIALPGALRAWLRARLSRSAD